MTPDQLARLHEVADPLSDLIRQTFDDPTADAVLALIRLADLIGDPPANVLAALSMLPADERGRVTRSGWNYMSWMIRKPNHIPSSATN